MIIVIKEYVMDAAVLQKQAGQQSLKAKNRAFYLYFFAF